MEEFLNCIKNKNFRAVFAEPTSNIFIQMFRYIFVGGGAFIVDSGSMTLLTLLGVNLYISIAIGFILGLVANYILSKSFVFSSEKSKLNGFSEFVAYALIGIAGLLITEFLMHIMVYNIGINFIVSKIFAAAVVLVWNFAARKFILYRGD